jgi:hypothetical protein
MERAGVTRAGRGGATCRVGMGDGTGTRGFKAVWPVFRAGLAARARLTWALALGLECLEDTGVLFLRLDSAFLECRAFPNEGFRDEDRADRGAFFLFKSFSLLESRAPSYMLENTPGPSSPSHSIRVRCSLHNGFLGIGSWSLWSVAPEPL